MKARDGFVSNSSSTSFVIDLSYASFGDPETVNLKEKIMNLTNRDDELGRATGRISNIEHWIGLHDDDYDFLQILKILVSDDYMKKHLVIVRESDEGVGGSLSDYNITMSELYPKVIYKFEYS